MSHHQDDEGSQPPKPKGDYEVGYKKPPVATRFQPGTGGPNKGRRKGSRNLKSDLLEELSERVTLSEGPRKVRISKQRALVKALVVKGIKGDPRSIDLALNLLLRLIGEEDPQATAPLSEDDQAIVRAFLERQEETDG
jgi:hypothetical protein